MKKRIPYAVLSTAMIVCVASSAIAAPAPTHEGIYIGGEVNKYYGFGDFIASTTKVDEMNAATLANVSLFQDGQIAKANDILLKGSLGAAFKSYAEGDLTGPYVDPAGQVVFPEQVQLTVSSATAVNQTTISVTFSDGVTQSFQVDPLVEGENTRTVSYQEQEFPVSVMYEDTTIPPVTPTLDKAAVEGVAFKDYRHFQVTFNQEVDETTATDPANYYMEIVGGDVEFGTYSALPTLQVSNRLADIETNYFGGATEWWKHNIVANVVDDKTVVDIYLPEDARCTTKLDELLADYGDDDERTLAVESRISQTAGEWESEWKNLIKNQIVNFAVRNVRDVEGARTIDTYVQPVAILDEVKPELTNVWIEEADGLPVYEFPEILRALPQELGPYTLTRSNPMINPERAADVLIFEYNEPVFDGHDLDKSDLDEYRNLKLYVDGVEVYAEDYLTFRMDRNANYDDSRMMTIDVENAVKARYGKYESGKTYKLHLVGVTDLAGNIEVASEHFFDVKVIEPQAVNPECPEKPELLGVEQVADNIIRLEFNQAGVTGEFTMLNADGEEGTLVTNVPYSQESANGKFYSYVTVNAIDIECNYANESNNGILAYDDQSFVNRTVKVTEVRNDSTGLKADNYEPISMKLYDDIQAPTVEADEYISDADRGDELFVHVSDNVPASWDAEDENVPRPTKAVRFEYAYGQFTNEALETGDYLPVKVSYEKDGVTHTALVSNLPLESRNDGFAGSIEFMDDTLILDLENYPELLDKDGKLVNGVTYRIELAKGYFSDSDKDDYPSFGFNGMTHVQSFVDAARTCLVGYTSAEAVVNVEVQEKQVIEQPVDDSVPQTSKQLINLDVPNNEIKIGFTGSIDEATLKDKNNYWFNGKTLAEWDVDNKIEVKYVKDYVTEGEQQIEKQYAVFKIPAGSIKEDGDVAFKVEGWTNKAGAKMTPVETVVRMLDNTSPVGEFTVTGEKQITVKFDEPVEYLVNPRVRADKISAAKNFKVMAGDEVLTVAEAVIIRESEYEPVNEVVLNLGSIIPDTDITVNIVPDQNGNILIQDISQLHNPVAAGPVSMAD